MKGVAINTTLKELNLADNKFSDENRVMSQIVAVIEENETL